MDDREEFESAYKEWMEAVQFRSSGQFEHPAYRHIVAMGNRAIPFILEKIKAAPDPVVSAMSEIVPDVTVGKEGEFLSLSEVCKIWTSLGNILISSRGTNNEDTSNSESDRN